MRMSLNHTLKPNTGIWKTLLSTCRVHGDLELGRELGDIFFLRLDSDSLVNYVMSPIFINGINVRE